MCKSKLSFPVYIENSHTYADRPIPTKSKLCLVVKNLNQNKYTHILLLQFKIPYEDRTVPARLHYAKSQTTYKEI